MLANPLRNNGPKGNDPDGPTLFCNETPQRSAKLDDGADLSDGMMVWVKNEPKKK